jgi:hypothetical protein
MIVPPPKELVLPRERAMKRSLVVTVLVVGGLLASAQTAAADSCLSVASDVTNPKFRGWLLACRAGTSLIVTNESRLVFRLRRNDNSQLTVHPASGAGLLGEVTRRAAPFDCDAFSCTLQPFGWAEFEVRRGWSGLAGGTADAQAGETAFVLAARLVAGKIDNFLKPRAQRNLGAVMACASGVEDVMWANGWDSAFESSLNIASTCPSLVRALRTTSAEERAWSSRIVKLGFKIVGEDGFADVVRYGVEALLRR